MIEIYVTIWKLSVRFKLFKPSLTLAFGEQMIALRWSGYKQFHTVVSGHGYSGARGNFYFIEFSIGLQRKPNYVDS